MKFTFSSLLIILSFSLFSQNRWNGKDVVRLEDAEIYLEILDYKSALDIYLDLYKKYGSTENMDYQIGLCYKGLGMMEEAKEYFINSREKKNPNAVYQLGLYHHKQSEFVVAIALFQAYRNMEGQKEFHPSLVERLIEICQRAEDMTNNPVHAQVYNVGKAINTEFDEYGPLITADETMLVFTSRRAGSTGGEKDPYGEFFEDVYYSIKEKDTWSAPVNIGSPINTSTHDAAVGLGPEGNSMIIYRTNKELTSGDLYMTHFNDQSWSEPEKMNESINTESQEASASFTQDERVIYFSSDRPGGLGGKDIYRVVRLGNNEWSLPMNLGPTINTAYDEDAPFIHPNGKTLYFSSKGHKTMGGYDIFKSNLGEEYWSTPQNLGYPVNTVRDDIFFVLAADGRRGYYSSELPEGTGGHDIYVVSFEDALESLRIVKGKISNQSGKGLTATITLFTEDGENAGIYNTNSLTGNYIIILPPNEEFNMVISSDGFAEVEETLFYKGGTNVRERVQNFQLKPELEQ